MTWLARYKASSFTAERNFERHSPVNNEAEPLNEEEQRRLDALRRKVDRHGSPSILTPEEYREYNILGERYNNAPGKGVLLPNAIKPWITQ